MRRFVLAFLVASPLLSQNSSREQQLVSSVSSVVRTTAPSSSSYSFPSLARNKKVAVARIGSDGKPADFRQNPQLLSSAPPDELVELIALATAAIRASTGLERSTPVKILHVSFRKTNSGQLWRYLFELDMPEGTFYTGAIVNQGQGRPVLEKSLFSKTPSEVFEFLGINDNMVKQFIIFTYEPKTIRAEYANFLEIGPNNVHQTIIPANAGTDVAAATSSTGLSKEQMMLLAPENFQETNPGSQTLPSLSQQPPQTSSLLSTQPAMSQQPPQLGLEQHMSPSNATAFPSPQPTLLFAAKEEPAPTHSSPAGLDHQVTPNPPLSQENHSPVIGGAQQTFTEPPKTDPIAPQVLPKEQALLLASPAPTPIIPPPSEPALTAVPQPPVASQTPRPGIVPIEQAPAGLNATSQAATAHAPEDHQAEMAAIQTSLTEISAQEGPLKTQFRTLKTSLNNRFNSTLGSAPQAAEFSTRAAEAAATQAAAVKRLREIDTRLAEAKDPETSAGAEKEYLVAQKEYKEAIAKAFKVDLERFTALEEALKGQEAHAAVAEEVKAFSELRGGIDQLEATKERLIGRFNELQAAEASKPKAIAGRLLQARGEIEAPEVFFEKFSEAQKSPASEFNEVSLNKVLMALPGELDSLPAEVVERMNQMPEKLVPDSYQESMINSVSELTNEPTIEFMPSKVVMVSDPRAEKVPTENAIRFKKNWVKNAHDNR